MSKFKLICKEIPKSKSRATGQKAQLGTSPSPDDAVSSEEYRTIGCLAPWVADVVSNPRLYRKGCLHGFVPRYRASSSATVSCRHVSGGVLGGIERFLTVSVLARGRSAGISGRMAVVDHAGAQSQGDQVLVSSDARKPFPPRRNTAAKNDRRASPDRAGR